MWNIIKINHKCCVMQYLCIYMYICFNTYCKLFFWNAHLKRKPRFFRDRNKAYFYGNPHKNRYNIYKHNFKQWMFSHRYDSWQYFPRISCRKTSQALSKNMSLVSKVPITKYFLCQKYDVKNSIIIRKTWQKYSLASSTYIYMYIYNITCFNKLSFHQ